MASYDWVGLAATLIQEGVKALVPGAGVAISVTALAMQPELDRARRWREDRQEQKNFSTSVREWAARNHIAEADIDLGMIAATRILRQSGAGWDDLTRLDLDAVRIAGYVLSRDPVAQKGLEPDAQEVCSYAVTVFYERLLAQSGLGTMSGSSLQELLRRSKLLDEKLAEVVHQVADLRVGGGQGDRSRRLLEETMTRISQLEGAQSAFRWETEPGSRQPNADAIRDARRDLVAARVGLEACAKQLANPDLRDRVLAYVLADEREDQALRSGTADPPLFDAIRSATIEAYGDAQDAVAQFLRAPG